MNVYHFPTFNFFDINNSFVVSPCSCDDDTTISQSHLLCRILVHSGVIVLGAFLHVFMIPMWARACWLNCVLFITDVISWSISLGSGSLSSHFDIKHLSPRLDPAVRVGPGLARAFGLWVRVWTVLHLLAEVGVRYDSGSFCSSGCCFSCRLGLYFSCGCSWHFSGCPSCVEPACCEDSRPLLSWFAVLSFPCFLTLWEC
jgi:hypothetical protein